MISNATVTKLVDEFGAPNTYVFHEAGYTSWVELDADGGVRFGPDNDRGWKVFENADWPFDYENYRNVAGNTTIRLKGEG